jgi:hypothetical protein
MPVEDVTEKSEHGPARRAIPNWEMISAYMRGEMTEEDYHDKYLVLLDENREALIEHFKHLESLPGYTKLALSCDCNPGHFCQRKLMAEWLAKNLGWEYEGEIKL